MHLRYSPQALRDLDRIWDDIANASASYDTADQYINQIRDAVKRKLVFPKSGTPLYYDNLFLGFWSVKYKTYQAFYRIHGDDMQVVRVFSMKSDYLRVLMQGVHD